MPADIASDIESHAADIKKNRTEMIARLRKYAGISDAIPSYEQLCKLKRITDSTAIPLCVFLKKLGAEAENTNALTARLMGNYTLEDNSKLLQEYTELRETLRERARDKTAFDQAFLLRSESETGEKGLASPQKSTFFQPRKITKSLLSSTNIKVGATIKFGHYPQNKDGRDRTPIEWRVLEVSGGKALLISEKAIDCQKYNKSYRDITWETCTLRKWMNSEFLSNTFTAEEQAQIQSTNVSADKNPRYNTNPGKVTKDKVFPLCIAELEKYFSTDEERKCVPTAYAKAQGVFTSDNNTKGGKATCWWWLRSPGFTQDYAARVYSGGSVDYDGKYIHSDAGCVRPALWIKLGT